MQKENSLMILNADNTNLVNSSSFLNVGYFCLTWKARGENCSIWVTNVFLALKLFFSLKVKAKLIYFPPSDDAEREILRR